MRPIHRLWPLAILWLLTGGMAGAQTPGGPPPVDAAAKGRVIAALETLLKDRYVDGALGVEIGKTVRKNLKSGKYDAAADVEAFAQALGRDLQDLSNDRHLRIRFNPEMAKMLADTGGMNDQGVERYREEARRRNYGFQKVEILPGNIGYLDLRQFAQAEMAAETAVAAMNFLAGSDALIIDLRNNGGGDPSQVQLLCSYLFSADEPVHLNSLYNRAMDQTNQFWTLPYVPGKRMADLPVFVLTSKRTFSGAEEFAYNLKNRKRATIIGEATGGGANPGGLFVVSDGFIAFISTGKAVNPVSKTNWEGTGVEPDIAVPADEALDVARAEAFKAVAAKTDDADWKRNLDWMREEVELRRAATPLSVDEMRAFAGTYGIRTVRMEEDRLLYQREGGPQLTMIPLGGDTFGLDGVDDVRIRFNRAADGAVTGFQGIERDGPGFDAPRSN